MKRLTLQEAAVIFSKKGSLKLVCEALMLIKNSASQQNLPNSFSCAPLESAGLFLLPPAINQDLNGTLSQLQLQAKQPHEHESCTQSYRVQIKTGLWWQDWEATCWDIYHRYGMTLNFYSCWNGAVWLADAAPLFMSPTMIKTRGNWDCYTTAPTKHFSCLGEIDPSHNSMLLL